MSTENISKAIINATRQKYRFTSANNKIEMTIENLWDLPLSSQDPKKVTLDSIGLSLYTEINNAPVISFVNNVSTKNVEAEEKLEIVKFIIATKQAENSVKENERRRKALLETQKEIASAVILDKQKEQLKDKSIEELQALLDQ